MTEFSFSDPALLVVLLGAIGVSSGSGLQRNYRKNGIRMEDYARWKLILPTTQHIQLNVQIVNEEQFPINHLHLSLIPE